MNLTLTRWFLILAECGDCPIIYPNSTKNFEKTPLEVKINKTKKN